MPESTSFHVGLTPEGVIDAAVDLTQESHLFSWSIRDLAKRLNVAPSVIYHHVGGKDLLCRGVVERLLLTLPSPEPSLDWQEWFRELLFSLEPVVCTYAGVAKWLLMHGPTFAGVVSIVETGMSALQRAGFGEYSGFAYSLMLNNTMMTIAAGDDRRQHEADGPRDHAAMMQDFAAVVHNMPNAEALIRSMVAPFASAPEDAAKARSTYYRFVVDTTIAGLEAWLAEEHR
ncbi:TetR/AcrR family transcriptional regulator [Actinomycetaceae bacterium L2_0104]